MRILGPVVRWTCCGVSFEPDEFNQMEAAELLGISEQAFRRWCQRIGEVPHSTPPTGGLRSTSSEITLDSYRLIVSIDHGTAHLPTLPNARWTWRLPSWPCSA